MKKEKIKTTGNYSEFGSKSDGNIKPMKKEKETEKIKLKKGEIKTYD